MKKVICLGILSTFVSTSAFSGGWEASKLSTSHLYEDGNYVEFSVLPLSYDVGSTIQFPGAPKHKVLSDQTRAAMAFKMDLGSFDIGVSKYMSGALLFEGQTNGNLTGCNPADASTLPLCSVSPSANVKIGSTTFLARYAIDENYSVFGGLNRYTLNDGDSVTTLSGYYEIDAADKTLPTLGAAYERSEIALKVELVYQPDGVVQVPMGSSLSSLIPTTPVSGASIAFPETTTLNFQSGIAEGTLLYGAIHQGKWSTAQIIVPANPNGINPATGAADAAVSPIGSSFDDKVHYSIGVGRKVSDELALSISYAREDGGGALTSDPFTFRNGYDTYSVSARYTASESLTISAGYTYTTAGDVKVVHEAAPGVPSGLTLDYTDNSVSGFGFKIGYSF
jgi:long-subunit fatty acid transport protein